MAKAKRGAAKAVETITHDEASRSIAVKIINHLGDEVNLPDRLSLR